MKPKDYFESGNLQGAIDAVVQHLKLHPTEVGQRLFLAELLCFTGELDRAEKQLDTITLQTTDAALTISLYRQILRGEIAREQVLREGRTPELVVPLPRAAELMLEALLAKRLDQLDQIGPLVRSADGCRYEVSGQCNGKSFVGIRDLDDRVADVLEVITSHGKYYWVPWSSIRSLEMESPQAPIDLLYRRTQIDVDGGPQGEVYVPTRYVAAADEVQSNNIKLCRATDWLGDEEHMVEGRGLRTLLIGDDDKTIMDIQTLTFGTETE